MGILDVIKSIYEGGKNTKTTSSSQETLEAETQQDVTFVDTTTTAPGEEGPARTGGFTVVGSGGGSSGGSGTQRIVAGSVSGDLTRAEAEQVQRARLERQAQERQRELERARASQDQPGFFGGGGSGSGLTREERDFIRAEEQRRQQTLTPEERQRLIEERRQIQGGLGQSLPPEELARIIAARDTIRSEQESRQQTLTLEERRRVLRREFPSEEEPFLFRKIEPLVDIKRTVQNNAKNIAIISSITPANLFRPSVAEVRSREFSIRVLSEFIPVTPLDVGLTAVPFGVGKLPKVGRVVVGVGAGTFGVAGATDTSLTIQERTASGLVAVAGVSGTAFELTPFVRGIRNRVSRGFKPVRTQERGFKAIELVDTEIGLIPPKSPLRTGKTAGVDLPIVSPLKRGGFDVKGFEKSLFISDRPQRLATSQRGFFKEGQDIPLEREFFTTPEEPFINIPETRVSRLGLGEGLFKIPKDSQLGFGVPPEAQVGLTLGRVGRTEAGGRFRIGAGSELEAIRSTGTVRTVREAGVTTIRGEGVRIFTFDLDPAGSSVSGGRNVISGSSQTITRISGETALAAGGTRTRATTERTQTVRVTSQVTPVTISPSTFTPPKISTTPTGRTSRSTGRSTRTTTTIPPPTIPTIPISPPSSPPTTTIIPPSSPPTLLSPLDVPRVPPQLLKNPPLKIKFGDVRKTQPSQQFRVLERRFGKFRPVGLASTIKQAQSLGIKAVSEDLGATFKIEQVRGRKVKLPIKIPGFRTKETSTGIEFIEPRRRRLSTRGEVREIQSFKALAPKPNNIAKDIQKIVKGGVL